MKDIKFFEVILWALRKQVMTCKAKINYNFIQLKLKIISTY